MVGYQGPPMKMMGPASIPGNAVYTTVGTFEFFVPVYRIFRIRLIGAGGAGCAVGPFNFATGADGGDATVAELGMVAGGGKGGRSNAGGAPGNGTGGQINESGNAGGGTNGGRGGSAAFVGNGGGDYGPAGAYPYGAAGNNYGGGGSAGRNPSGACGGGGGGAGGCYSEWGMGQTGAPLVGMKLTLVVPAGGPLNTGQGYYGGPGAGGRIGIEWL